MDIKPPGLPELVQEARSLDQLVSELGRQRRIAVDTESNSLHAYRERVCLIQFSTEQRDYVVDPLALDDMSPLGPIFANPAIEKIFHAAEYDILCLRRDFEYSITNIFDTMQADRILGRKQAGLDRLLAEKFGVTHNKRLQKADWGVRPLSPELLLYAARDTHYLIPVRDLLEAELEGRQLLQLALEDFEMACNGTAPKPRPQSPSWERFRLRRDLSPREMAVAHELLMWRETVAARLDRPPFRVLHDDKLAELARSQPATIEALHDAGLGVRQIERWGKDILRAVAEGRERAPVKRAPSASPGRPYLRRLERLKKWRKKTAAEMGVESDVVLPRPLLLALAERGPEALQAVMASSPWRWRRFGEQIAQVVGAGTPHHLTVSA
ncbi:MAG: ribonuclease D [Anaerolineales bacterium]|jgi:ribonuclease D